MIRNKPIEYIWSRLWQVTIT